MHSLTIVLLALIVQPLLVNSRQIVHEVPGIPEKVEIPQFPAYKPVKEISVPKPMQPKVVAKKAPTRAVVTGDWVARCHRWAKMAGFSLPPAAITLISRESKCSPVARNPSSSAGGIGQALPWTKMGCRLEWSDSAGVCQIKWMKSYTFGRYGSWESALSHSHAKGWY